MSRYNDPGIALNLKMVLIRRGKPVFSSMQKSLP